MTDMTIVMPYYERGRALKNWLENTYPLIKEPVRVIIVDDGSIDDPASALVGHLGEFQVIELPKKRAWLNPCVPINIGMREANTDLVCLTSCENTLTRGVIDSMIRKLVEFGRGTYVTTHGKGGGDDHLYYCAGMWREDFWEWGGIDESYRPRPGEEDNVWRDMLLEKRDKGELTWLWAEGEYNHRTDLQTEGVGGATAHTRIARKYPGGI